jgi:hypothetical protein
MIKLMETLYIAGNAIEAEEDNQLKLLIIHVYEFKYVYESIY